MKNFSSPLRCAEAYPFSLSRVNPLYIIDIFNNCALLRLYIPCYDGFFVFESEVRSIKSNKICN